VGGGGRYDGLVEQVGGQPTPGVGWGSGLERIALAMREPLAVPASTGVFVVAFSDDVRPAAFAVAERLRRSGVPALLDLAGRSPKGQLKQAGRSGARFAVLLGLEELADGVIRLKDLAGGGEEDVAAAALPALVAARLESEA
jgi:histidyl-tRNA synthetase